MLEGPTTPGSPENYGPFMVAPLNYHGGYLWSCNFAIRKALFEEIGGFDAGFPHPHLEDVDLRLRLDDRGTAYPFVPGAEMVHPPRPIVPVLKWVRSQESAFYLARKRGVPASSLGQSFSTHLRGWYHTLRHCRSWAETVLMTWQSGVAACLVAFRWPFWAWKYRRN